MTKKRQINIRLEEELYFFLVKYAENNYKSVTGVLREIIAKLYKQDQERLIVDENNQVVIKDE